MFQKQVSATLCIFYRNSLFVQKKDKIGAFYKQGSGLTHSLVQENPEKNNSKASFSLDCAKYPPPLQSKAKPLAPLSCRFARSTGDPPGGWGEAPHSCPGSQFLPASPGAQTQVPLLDSPCSGWTSWPRALCGAWGGWCWMNLQEMWSRAASPCQALTCKACPQVSTPRGMKSLIHLHRNLAVQRSSVTCRHTG